MHGGSDPRLVVLQRPIVLVDVLILEVMFCTVVVPLHLGLVLGEELQVPG